jgi:hypothetical protein
MPIVPSNGEILRRKNTAISMQRIFAVAPTAPNGGLIQCLSQSHYKETTMFDMNLPQNLGVLPVQHETLLVDALQSVGQEAGNGPWPPAKIVGGDLALPSVGQGQDGGPWPPAKIVGCAGPVAKVEFANLFDAGAVAPSVGQGEVGGPRPPTK